MNTKGTFYICLIFAVCLSGLLSTSCKQKSSAGKLIITEVPFGKGTINTFNGDAGQIPGARIILLDPEKPSRLKILTGDFYSACSPDISWDGSFMLFSAQQKENDPWQIWEMDLKKLTSRRITKLDDDCTNPVLLPTGRVIFSRHAVIESAYSVQALYNCNSDGSDVKQITFHPHANYGTMVMRDGRLLTITRQLFPVSADPLLMVLRPDGTKADLFYKGSKGSILSCKASEDTNGRIFFVEADSSGKNADIVSIAYNRPLHTKKNLTGEIQGEFNAVCPVSADRLLVSYRSNNNEPFAIYEYDIIQMKLGERIYGSNNTDIVEAVWVNLHERPKKLPSEVDMGVKTGQIMCQDINFTELAMLHENTSFKKADRIEVIGIDSSLGIVDVEKDGSFYLKVMADRPFRIRTLDNDNKEINGPGAWLWLRPNERRGCVGCHEDRELAPENNVPLAVKKNPVNIPVDGSKVTEKKVELE